MAQAIDTRGASRGPVTGTAAVPKKRRKFFLTDLYATAVGKKYAMALTGLMMVGFVVVHMIGNLKMFQGPEAFNKYGEFLKKIAYPLLPKNAFLWIARFALAGALMLHLHAALGLTRMNRKARPVKYQSARDYQVASFASRTMRWTGIIVLLFIIWHLLDLTFGTTNAIGQDGQSFVRGDIYGNVVRSFERVPVSIFYIVANIALGTHLFHGVWSLFQSMGWNRPRFNRWRKHIAVGIATIVVAGNVSFPLAVMAGIVGE